MSQYEVRAEIPFAASSEIDDVLVEREAIEWNILEDVIVKRAWIIGIFPSDNQAKQAGERLLSLLPVATLSAAVITEIKDQDWKDSYKAHFKAWKFGKLNWVPIWEKETFRTPPGDAVLWLDPGLAFGTGNHETTRLCIELLVKVAEPLGSAVATKRVVDAGCGSGILALSAALLGFTDVDGFDNDDEAVRVSEENAELNGLKGRVHFHTADLDSGLSKNGADILMANILANILVDHREQLISAVRPGGILILSGILATEIEAVRLAFEESAPGWVADAQVLGEWAAASLVRPI
jgi:ribosomal protein L11 methyltransferase